LPISLHRTLERLFVPGVHVPTWLLQATRLRSLTLYGGIAHAAHQFQTCRWLTSLALYGDHSAGILSALDLDGLVALKLLYLRGWNDTMLMPTIGNLRALAQLCIIDFPKLRSLPDSISQLEGLEKLALINCASLTCLPAGMDRLQALRELSVRATPLTQLSAVLECTRSVSSVELDGIPTLDMCKTMTRHLDITDTAVSTFAGMPNVEFLGLLRCNWVTDEPAAVGFHLLHKLEHLSVTATSLAAHMPHFAQLQQLTTLSLHDVTMSALPACMGELRNLRKLVIMYCPLDVVPGHIPLLEHLALIHCNRLHTWPDTFASVRTLRELQLSGSNLPIPAWFSGQDDWKLLGLPPSLLCWPAGLTELRSLTDLCCSGCDQLTSLPDGPVHLISLQTLSFAHCSALTALPAWIGDLHALRKLSVRYCARLAYLPAELGNAQGLVELRLHYSSLTTLPASLARLQNLCRLELKRCARLQTIPAALAVLPITPLALCHRLRMQYRLPHMLVLVMASRRNRRTLPREITEYICLCFLSDMVTI
jgi:Leucine-rich repeat (LRR) protein